MRIAVKNKPDTTGLQLLPRRTLPALLLASVAFGCFAQQPPSTLTQADSAIEQRIQVLLAQLTLSEKASLLSGTNRFMTVAVPRLGIPSVRMADGPNGVRSNETLPATVFPVSVAMAATWDPDISSKVANAIGHEALAYDYHVVLGPALNIQRVPVGGRNFEYLSEDPYLTSRMAVAWTRGLQSTGVLATPKHFAANNQEHERRRVSANVSERALREIYFPGFQAVVTEAKPGMIMTSYNRLNGVFNSENQWLLRTVLQGEWGFKGVTVSDWGATHSTVQAINTGLNLEMPGPPIYFGAALVDAVHKGQVSNAVVDEAVGRVLRTIIRTGLMDGRKKGPQDVLDSPKHRAVSLTAAEEAITLLKNDRGTLPLNPRTLRSIAIIGPNADARVIQGSGSSEVTPIRVVTPLDGLRAALPSSVDIRVNSGVTNDRFPPVADPRFFSTTLQRADTGLTQQYWTHGEIAGEPVRTITDNVFMRFDFGEDLAPDPKHDLAMQWTGYFWPPKTGEYEFSLFDHGTSTVWLDGKVILAPSTPDHPSPLFDMFEWRSREAKLFLKAGQPYAFRMDFLPAGAKRIAYRLGIQPPSGSISEAVAIAKGADAAIIFAGSSTTSESETSDRPDLKLYGEQNALIEAVAAVNPRTIVVLNNGGPLEMPWADKVASIVEAWFLGGETGTALANVLTGQVNPSGKLPVTFPKKNEDNPTYAYYPGGLEATYGEDLLVGYRWYDAKNIEPLFPFGYGLSYTQFSFNGLSIRQEGTSWRVTAKLKNVGKMAGAEVAQLYIGLPQSSGEPIRQLKGFKRVSLKPNAEQQISFMIDRKDISYWDTDARDWRVAPGTYAVQLGNSSRNLPLSGQFTVSSE